MGLVSIATRLRRTPLRDWPTLALPAPEAALVWMGAFGASAVLGVLRQVLLNARFGLGPEAAAYYAAFRLPETVAVLIAGGALTNALIPVLLRAARDGEQAATRLINLVLTALLAVFAPLCILAALLAPVFVRVVLAPGFDPATQALTAALTRVMLLEVLLLVAEAALVAILVSRNQVLLPALAIALHNLALLGGVAAAFLVPEVGIYGPTVGSVLDALIKLAVLVPGLRGHHYAPRLAWNPRDPQLRATLGLLWPSAVAGITNYAGSIVDTAFATLSGSVAAVGALANALLLVGLPIRLLGIAIGQALLPEAAMLGLRAETASVRSLIARTLLIACGLAVAAAAALLALGRPVIALLFERGAFDAAAGDLTYAMLAVYALGLPAYVATEVAARALLARRDARTPMLANLLQLGLRVGLCTALIGPLGPAAIPTAFAISAAAEAATLVFVLFRSKS